MPKKERGCGGLGLQGGPVPVIINLEAKGMVLGEY